MTNLEMISAEQQHKLQKSKVSIIGNNVLGEIVLANLVGLGVQEIVFSGERTSKHSPFSTALPSFFQRLNPYLNLHITEEPYVDEHTINVSSIENERKEGDIYGQVENDKGIVSKTKSSASLERLDIGGVVAALCADEFRKNVIQYNQDDLEKDYIEYQPALSSSKPKVLIVGAGGIGNYCAIACAEKGLSAIVVDGDEYEKRNRNRQVYFVDKELKSKRLTKVINENYDLDWDFDENYFEDKDYGADVVLGCVDNIETRLQLQDYSKKRNMKYIDGGVFQLQGQALVNRIIPEIKKQNKKSCSEVKNPSIITPNCIVGFHLPNMLDISDKYRFYFNSLIPKRIGEKYET